MDGKGKREMERKGQNGQAGDMEDNVANSFICERKILFVKRRAISVAKV